MRDHARLHFEGDDRFAALLILADGAVEPGADGQWQGCLAMGADGMRCNQRAGVGPYCPIHKPCEADPAFNRPIRPRDETLYFITDGSGHTKIGFSQHPRKRVNELQTGNPRKLTLLRTVDVPVCTEARIHHMLREHQVSGEWFEDCPAVDELLNASREQIIRKVWGRIAYDMWARLQIVEDTWEQVIDQTLGRDALNDFLREQALDGGLAPRTATSGL